MPCSCALRRNDAIGIPIGSSLITPEGRLTIVARAGGVLNYPLRGAVERVDPATLADGLESLIGVPVERDHGGLVIGHVENARVDSGRILCDLLITSHAARADIASGNLAEASADYDIGRLDSENTQLGPFKYRALALIPPGVSRCGPTCGVVGARTDALGCTCRAPGASGTPQEPQSMKIKIAGKEYEAGSPEAEAALAGVQTRLDALEADAVKLRAERSARVRQDATRAGVTVRKDADDMTVMSDVIAKVFPTLDLSSQSPDWISGAFAAAIADLLDEDPAETPAPPTAGATPPPKPGEPPAMGAAGARADAVNARQDAVITHNEAPVEPPDVLARNKMIRRGQSLATKEA